MYRCMGWLAASCQPVNKKHKLTGWDRYKIILEGMHKTSTVKTPWSFQGRQLLQLLCSCETGRGSLQCLHSITWSIQKSFLIQSHSQGVFPMHLYYEWVSVKHIESANHSSRCALERCRVSGTQELLTIFFVLKFITQESLSMSELSLDHSTSSIIISFFHWL